MGYRLHETASGGNTSARRGTYAEKALEYECQNIECSPEKQSNTILNQAAFKVGQLVASGELDRMTAESALLASAQARKIPSNEARATIKSGLDGGRKQPRDMSGIGSQSTGLPSAKPTPRPIASTVPAVDEQDAAERKRKAQTANQILKASIPIGGTLAERYLRSRGITVTSPDLLFNEATPIGSGQPNETSLPALICRVRNVATGRPQAVVRIFLDPATGGKADMPDGGQPKRNLGPAKDGAVLFGDIGAASLVVECEGVETAASVHQATGHCAIATLSGGQLGRAALPTHITQSIVHAEIGTEKFAYDGAARRVAEGKLVWTATSFDPECEDGNDLLQCHGAAGVKRMIDEAVPFVVAPPPEQEPANEQQADTPDLIDDPVPILDTHQVDVGEYPIDALGDLAKYVRTVQSITQTPAGLAAIGGLTTLSMVAQSYVDVMTLEGFSKPTSIFFLVVGQSGERKSGVERRFMTAVRERANELEAEAKLLKRRQEIRIANYDAEYNRIKNSKAPPIEREADMMALGERPSEARGHHLTVKNFTSEGLQRMLRTGQPSIGAIAPEGGTILAGPSMTEDNRLKTCAALIELWDGSKVEIARAGEGVSSMDGRRLTFSVMVQEHLAKQFIGNEAVRDQGLPARMLIAHPETTVGTRQFRQPEQHELDIMREFHDEVLRRMRRPLPLRDGTDADLSPRVLSLDGTAKSLLIEFYNWCEVRCAKGGEFDRIVSFALKSAEHAARIAGLLTWWRDEDCTRIDDEAVVGAIEIVKYHISEARRLWRAAGAPDADVRAQSLLDWLHAKGDDAVTVRKVVRGGPAQLRNSSAAREAINILVDHRWLARLPAGTLVGGKPSRDVWRVVQKPQED
jgi:hypothetical protein